MNAGKYELELLAIRTLCAGKEAGVTLLNHVNPKHFHYSTTQLLYRRIVARLKGEGTVPAWNDLINDATIPDDKRVSAQRNVRLKNIKPLVSQRKGEALFESLDGYRQWREFYELMNISGNAMKMPSADIREIIKKHKGGVIAIDVNQRGAPVTVAGVRKEHVNSSLTNIDARIETGFSEYDEKSGGIPQGAVFLLGAESGQYKSVMAVQLAKNIAKGRRTEALYSLEMPQPEVTQRMVANELELDISDTINRWQWQRRQAKSAKAVEAIDAKHFAWAATISEQYDKATEDWADFLHITCPSDGVDINWVLQQAEMSDREIIFLDYLGLLEGLSGDDQWRAMSNAARVCKIWTNRTGKTVILLTQMRFENGAPDLKYSRAVKDHVNNMWGWEVLEVNGRTYLCVHQAKARGSRAYHFVLRVWPEFNKIGNLVDDRDREVAAAAVEDMKAKKDPAARYEKSPPAAGDKERRNIEIDDDEPLLQNGGFSGRKSYETSAPWDDDDDLGLNVRKLGSRITASSIMERAKLKTRAIALSKMDSGKGSLTLEEAGIQAEEVIRRWEEASLGHRMQVNTLTRELLGLTATKSLLTEIRKLQGDSAARKRLTPQQLEIHKAQVEIMKEATNIIRTKGKEFVSEDDFYAADDLTLATERGEEPIASPKTLDQQWQDNAVAWADQPAITLPNSAKPKERRWGNNGEEESVKAYKRTVKDRENSVGKRGRIGGKRVELWPPKGKLDNYHYLDDVQLDTVVGIATKLAKTDLNAVPLSEVAYDLGQYFELLGPGKSRMHNRKRKRVVFNDDSYKAACKKLGLKNAA